MQLRGSWVYSSNKHLPNAYYEPSTLGVDGWNQESLCNQLGSEMSGKSRLNWNGKLDVWNQGKHHRQNLMAGRRFKIDSGKTENKTGLKACLLIFPLPPSHSSVLTVGSGGSSVAFSRYSPFCIPLEFTKSHQRAAIAIDCYILVY